MRYLLGPELLWLLLYGAVTLVAKANVPVTKAMDRVIETSWFWIPLLALLTFALWWFPAVEKNWLMLRVWIACLVGGHYAIEKALSAYSSQGPGVGMGYLAGMLLIIGFLTVGSIIVKIKF